MNDDTKQYLASIGARGGKAGAGKAKARTKEHARAAAKARWDKARALRQNDKLTRDAGAQDPMNTPETQPPASLGAAPCSPDWRAIADDLAAALERLDTLYRSEQDPEAPMNRPEWLRHPWQRYHRALADTANERTEAQPPENQKR